MPKPVLVVGDLNADLILTDLSSAPQPGREVLAGGCVLTLGGSSSIFAAGAARLGARVAFAGRVGRDETGDLMLRLLRARKVEVSGVRRDPKGRTGITVSISHPPDRALVTFLGTIAETALSDVRVDFRKFAHLHMSAFYLQTALRPHVPAILARARKAGLGTSFDPGWDPSEKWEVEAALPNVDTLFVNLEEAAAMTKLSRSDDAAVALSRRVKTAVVKLGPGGSMAATAGKIVRAPGFRVKAVDPTGAGDAFDAGFVVAALSGKSIKEALLWGNACGALSTLRPGGYDGQPSLKEALALMKVEA